MKTIFINLPHKLLLLVIFALTYILALYFALYSHLNNILIGDAAKSLTFIWTVFLLTVINLFYRIILMFRQNPKVTKFLIRTNVEYGKIYSGLFLTASIFFVQAIIVNMAKITTTWQQDKGMVLLAALISIAAFLLFPALAAIINYFIVKYFRRALWGNTATSNLPNITK